MSLTIEVNGEPRAIPEGTTVAELVELLGLRPEVVAIERNQALVRRTERGSTRLLAGDRVEVVTLVGGG